MYSILLRATQIKRIFRFISCATHSHSAKGVFAMAKTAWLSVSANGAAITRASKGLSNATAFANPCCWR